MNKVSESGAGNFDQRMFELRPWLYRAVSVFQAGTEFALDTLETIDAFPVQMCEQEGIALVAGLELGSRRKKMGSNPLPDDILKIGQKYVKEHIHEKRESFEAEYGPVVTYIRQAALVRAWASLEGLAEELWTCAIDLASRKFRTSCFDNAVAKASLPGLEKKSVTFGELQEFNFDLSGNLGTFLARKCSFKTVRGIRAAFKAGFQWTGKTPDFLNPGPLGLVEAKRHCIVHRGGLVDPEYLDRVRQQSESPPALGSVLETTLDSALFDLNQIFFEGLVLSKALFDLLEAHDPEGNRIIPDDVQEEYALVSKLRSRNRTADSSIIETVEDVARELGVEEQILRKVMANHPLLFETGWRKRSFIAPANHREHESSVKTSNRTQPRSLRRRR